MSSSIGLRGSFYSLSEINRIITQSEYEDEALGFIQDWLSGREVFEQYTSGSTGNPKLIQLTRSQMMASALGSIKALNLKPNTTSLLCLNPKFIGGKMVIVRSLLNKMNLILTEPTANPFKTLQSPVNFVALTPHQLMVTLMSKEDVSLNYIETLIIGGAPVNASLESKIQHLDCAVYSTYGMTETSSHIALKKLNGNDKSAYYTALDEIELNVNERECLTIKGAVTNFETIVTNDRVNLINDRQFEWLGRIDNVINSGGIKIQSEKVERIVGQVMVELGLTNRSFVTGLPDTTYGEQVTLFIEGKLDSKATSSIKSLLTDHLNKYEVPKNIIELERFKETDSGKVDKIKTKKSIKT